MDGLNAQPTSGAQAHPYSGYSHTGNPSDLNPLSVLLDGSTPSMAQADGTDGYGGQQMGDVGYQSVGNEEGDVGDMQRKVPLRTLPAVLAGYVRDQGKPVPEKELIDEVRKVYKELRKPDGTKYTGNLERAVRGSLCSTGLFEKLDENMWTLKEEATRLYERRLIDRATKQEAEKGKKRKSRDDDVGGEGEEPRRRYQRRSSTGPRMKRAHKREAIIEMVNHFAENLRNQPNWANCFQNPFKSFKGDETEDEVWKKLGNERFVFMLQVYHYLQEIIVNRHVVSEALAKERQAQKAEKVAGQKSSKRDKAKGGGLNITEGQLQVINKNLRSLEDSISKLNNRITNVDEILDAQQPAGIWGQERAQH